jgi:hypothetical protein
MTARTRLATLGLAFAASLVATVCAAADKGGPSPGVQLTGQGLATTDGALRYATRSRAGLTTVTAFDADGRRLRERGLRGVVGIPFVAFDGSVGGLSGDGRRLVLAAPRPVRGSSRFTIVSTRSLRPVRTVTLPGRWSFDALSPDGRKLYLVEHSAAVTYRVRAYDVVRGALLREAVIDPRLGGRAMSGAPVTQALGPGAVWVYTLYQKPRGLPFVHALDTVRGKALCIELPWRGDQSRLFDVRMRVQGRNLVLRTVRGARVASVDMREFLVHTHHNPLGLAP